MDNIYKLKLYRKEGWRFVGLNEAGEGVIDIGLTTKLAKDYEIAILEACHTVGLPALSWKALDRANEYSVTVRHKRRGRPRSIDRPVSVLFSAEESVLNEFDTLCNEDNIPRAEKLRNMMKDYVFQARDGLCSSAIPE